MPKVTVIVPVYGVEKYIERCAISLFEQTLDDIEIIFVNDCTPDRSMEILDRIIEKYRFLFEEKKYIVRTESMLTNSGQAAVREHGTKLAIGDYIIHCDSDDWVEKTWLELMYEKADNENIDVVFCDYYRVIDNRKVVCENKCDDGCSNDYYIRRLLTKQCCTSVWNKLVKRGIYQSRDFLYPQCNMWEDYYISTQLFFYAKKIGYLNRPLYNYFCNRQSICYASDYEKKLEQVVVNCDGILSFLKEHNLDMQYSEEIIVLKNSAKREALSSFWATDFYRLWKNIYPGIGGKYLFSRIVSLKDKFQYLIIMLGLYPAWIKLMNRAQ